MAGPAPARMPPFCRIAWVGEAARQVWAPRLEAVRTALEDAALERALADARAFAVRPGSVARLTDAAAGLGVSLESVPAPEPGPFDTAYGLAGRCWLGDAEQGGEVAVGLQACRCAACASAGDADPAEADPVWRSAQLTSGADAAADARRLAFAGHWSGNPLLAALGVLPARDWPVCLGCAARRAEAERLVAESGRAGRGEAMDWMQQMLGWPMRWSSLHGIVEVKTPVFRYVRDSCPAPQVLVFEWIGDEPPPETARGLGFPFSVRRAGARQAADA